MVPESYATMQKATPRRPVERSPWFILLIGAVFLAGYGLVMGTGPGADEASPSPTVKAGDPAEGAVGLDGALEASPSAVASVGVVATAVPPASPLVRTATTQPAANVWTNARAGLENALWLSPPVVVRTDMTNAVIPVGERVGCGLSPQGLSTADRSAWYWIELADPGTLAVGQYGVEGAIVTAVWGPFAGLPSSLETRRPRWCVNGTGLDATLSEPIDAGVWLLQLTTSADRELSPTLAVSFSASAVTAAPTVTVLVVPGDTFSGIAVRYGLSVEALAAANPQVSDPSLIHTGDRIVVPASGPDRRPDGTHDLSYDPAACSAVGWTRDQDDLTRILSVRVLVDGTVRASVLADGYRADLAEVFHDTGLYAFDIDLRHLVTPGVEHEIRVQARDAETGNWSDLNLTPRLLTCT
jgi:LysM repeat protein